MTRREEVKQTHHDSEWMKLFESMKIGVIVIGKEGLRIKRYNHSAKEIFSNDLSVDTPITEVSDEFVYDDIVPDLKQFFKDLKPIRNLVSTKDGKWYLLALEVFKASKNSIDKGILSMVDVTDLKVELEEKVEAEKQLHLQILNVEEKERWRLGQYLHDSTAQNLLAISMLLDNIDPRLQQLDEKTRTELKKNKTANYKNRKKHSGAFTFCVTD